ncbi:uncharacterized protein LOC62_01G001374 [Vanrija pseudolonga]|uniref:Uncharacterized protein n=1 Tax=Vanrija pseudolonga TaxID=143232 RepID=A0AAF0Y6R8_9TREE|nr:hypothetical protein LOC62_01G001374 [Vanrija pseudolonga]WOO77814.1 hypothetical protein LOC62_01G001374 [Vanrija pseudolonga]
MPGLFSSVPILSSLPNPLNFFSTDDNNPPSPRQQQSAMSSPTAEAGPGPNSRSNPILLRTTVDLSAPAVTSPLAGSPLPAPVLRTEAPSSGSSNASSLRGRPSPGRKGSSAIIITDPEGADSDTPRAVSKAGGRRRGLSSASRVSGAPSAGSGVDRERETRGRRRKFETFVLVKPPPTSAKNPLNLQVQLVVPAKPSRPRGGSEAVRSVTPAPGDLPPSAVRASIDIDPVGMVPSTSMTGSDASDSPLPTVGESSGLKRSGSIKSNHSTNSSATSQSSAAVVLPGSSNKRIIPLYNLAVHNVMQPTTVTDAGTDSKVAKFGKRTLDIAGVGILEPSEVWYPLVGHVGGSPRPSFEASSTNSGRLPRPASMISNMSMLTPAGSRLDVDVKDVRRSSTDVRPTVAAREEAGGEAKKFFGKLFKKKSTADQLAVVNEKQNRRASKVFSNTISSSKSSPFLSVDAAPLPRDTSAPSSPQVPTVHFNGESSQLASATFGLAPCVVTRQKVETYLDRSGAIIGLVSDVPAIDNDDVVSLFRSARPVGYTWTVRKWAKKNTEGWAAHIVAAAAAGLDLNAGALPGDGADEVVFEWVKLRLSPLTESAAAALKLHPAAEGISASSARRPLRPRPRRLSTLPAPMPPGARLDSPSGSPRGSKTSLILPAGRARSSTVGQSQTPSTLGIDPSAIHARPADVHRGSPSPSRSRTPRPGSTINSALPSENGDALSSGSGSNDFDDGYESDPEDSETPWACSVWVKRTGQRQLLATLTPAPHHPKVIGVLKIPSGLKAISLAALGPSVNNDIASRIREEVALTEENLKDVVNVTAMWLVAREEFGGLGATSKKKKEGAKPKA